MKFKQANTNTKFGKGEDEEDEEIEEEAPKAEVKQIQDNIF